MKLQQQFLFIFTLVFFYSCNDNFNEQNISIIESELPSVIDLLNEENKAHFSSEELEEMKQLESEYLQVDQTKKSNHRVFIPAGSVDQIQQAVLDVPNGGTIFLKAGTHRVTSTIHVHDKRVNFVGLGTTELILDINPINSKGYVEAGIHFQNAGQSRVTNISFSPAGDIGGTAIFIQESDNAVIYSSSFTDFEHGILIDQTDRSRIYNNTIVGHPRWIASNLTEDVYGVTVVNGEKTILIGNTITNSIFGTWLCGRGGRYFSNTTEGNFIGSILCNVPPFIPLINGDIIGSEVPATNWITAANSSNDNFYTGYSVTDGSTGNMLGWNKASGNAAYDFEVMGDTNFFGFFTPTATNNRILLTDGQVLKDCAERTRVINVGGGIIVDTSQDPCPE